jgi:hypothetical protein
MALRFSLNGAKVSVVWANATIKFDTFNALKFLGNFAGLRFRARSDPNRCNDWSSSKMWKHDVVLINDQRTGKPKLTSFIQGVNKVLSVFGFKDDFRSAFAAFAITIGSRSFRILQL